MQAPPLFRTTVTLPRPLRLMEVEDRSVFLGSCFAEAMGSMFVRSRLNALICPLGVLYNPASIALALTLRTAGEAVCGPLGWHTWHTGTALTCDTEEQCTAVAQRAHDDLRKALLGADHIFLTLGTNHVFRLARTGDVVTNCHKHKSSEFREEEMEVQAMADLLENALCLLREENSRFDATLTVSPYRYTACGMHASNLAKARLLLAAEELQRRHPEWIQYFPAYEIVKDELRDYRFYADDMLHPSPQATAYVATRLREWMSPQLTAYLERWERIERILNHRPLRPSRQAQGEQEQARLELRRLQEDYPTLPILSEAQTDL